MAYLAGSTYNAIRNDPAEVVSVYNSVRDTFRRDLGLPELSEAVTKAAFCAVVAYGLAPYGPNPGSTSFNVLAHSPTLACAAYVSVAMALVDEFGLSNVTTSAVGWDGGAVGNHAQLLVSDGFTSALLDPTIGLVVSGATLEKLIFGTHFSRMTSFFDRNDIPQFNELVIDAVANGKNSISDVIYYVPTYDDWLHRYSEFQGLELSRGGTDFRVGSLRNDVLHGDGNDKLYGGKGNDTFYVIGQGDQCFEKAGQGTDTVCSENNYVIGANIERLTLLDDAMYGNGNAGNNVLTGNNFRNVLSGLAGNDTLYGRGGNDFLSGGNGNDKLVGGAGSDVLWGLAGADTFVFASRSDLGVTSSTADLIKDFDRSDGDRIDLSGIDANEARSGNQAFTFVEDGGFTKAGQVRAFHAGGETRIILNTDSDKAFEGLIRVAGHHDVDASWFIL